ncbi:hypothetical protein [Alloyangia pacifica]|uniref:hypothetical protein n=1 Tax=Alloyangia pacifica TaxID=311180 RepID=UPI0031DC11DE
MNLRHTFLQNGRGLEWLTSSVLFAFAVSLAWPGDTLVASRSFAGFVGLGMGEGFLILVLTAVALVRYSGLWANGNVRSSPLWRGAGAIVGAGIFASLSVIFALPYLTGQQDALNTGVGTYLVLAIFDVLAAYRASADVGIYRVSKRH